MTDVFEHRRNLYKRLIKSLEQFSDRRKIEIILAWMNVDELQLFVEHQESRNEHR